MSWLLSSIIDPQLGLSKEDERHVLVVAWSTWLDKPWKAIEYTVCMLVLMAGTTAVKLAMRAYMPGPALLHDLLWFAMIAAVVFGIAWLFRQRTLAPLMYQELRRKGYDVCKRCGYVLGGLDPCPECGTKHKECA